MSTMPPNREDPPLPATPGDPPVDAAIPAPPEPRFLTAADLESSPRVPVVVDEFRPGQLRYRRRWGLPLVLFLASCVTTFMAGIYNWTPVLPDASLPELVRSNWPQGLEYMVAVMAVLLAHEMGHFLMTVRYRIPASYPIFIPMPIFMMTGTMGAVIGMDGLRANRRQLFDIGLAGPLAGLVLTIPLVWIGLLKATEPPAAPLHVAAEISAAQEPAATFGQPLLVKLLLKHLRPDWPEGRPFNVNALYMAGWVGMLVTGLNMMPVSQLDGGHIIYGLLGRRSRWIGRAFLIGAIAAMIFSENYNWLVMLLLVAFIGTDHPPTANDRVSIGAFRWIIGAASLAIPILCFTPTPLVLDDDRDVAATEWREAGEMSSGIGEISPERSLRLNSHELSYRRATAASLAQKMPAPKPSVFVVADPAAAADALLAIFEAATCAGVADSALCGARGCCSGGCTLLAASLPGRL